MATLKTHLNRCAAAVQLADTYAVDGAYLSASRCLIDAAEHMRKAGERRSRQLILATKREVTAAEGRS